jgi:hypothetical protein
MTLNDACAAASVLYREAPLRDSYPQSYEQALERVAGALVANNFAHDQAAMTVLYAAGPGLDLTSFPHMRALQREVSRSAVTEATGWLTALYRELPKGMILVNPFDRRRHQKLRKNWSSTGIGPVNAAERVARRAEGQATVVIEQALVSGPRPLFEDEVVAVAYTPILESAIAIAHAHLAKMPAHEIQRTMVVLKPSVLGAGVGDMFLDAAEIDHALRVWRDDATDPKVIAETFNRRLCESLDRLNTAG